MRSDLFTQEDVLVSYIKTLRTVAWALCNLLRGDTPASALIETGRVPQFIALLSHPDPKSVSEISWIFTFLTASDNDECIEYLMQCGLAQALVMTAGACTGNVETLVPVTRSLGNLTSEGPEHWLDTVIACDHFWTLLEMYLSNMKHLDDSSSLISKESIRLVINILSSDKYRFACLERGTLDVVVVGILGVDGRGGSGWTLKRSYLLALLQACRNAEAALRVARPDIILQVIGMLKSPDADIILSCITCLRLIALQNAETVKLCCDLDVIDALESVQYVPNDKAVKDEAADLCASLSVALDDVGEEEEDSTWIPQMESSTLAISGPELSSGQMGQMGRGRHLSVPAWMSR